MAAVLVAALVAAVMAVVVVAVAVKAGAMAEVACRLTRDEKSTTDTGSAGSTTEPPATASRTSGGSDAAVGRSEPVSHITGRALRAAAGRASAVRLRWLDFS